MKAAKRAKRSGAVPDFHRLRIRCKRLRYALEFSCRGLRRTHHPFRQAAHRAPRRARRHAGRRGGLDPAGRPGHRRGAPATGHRVRHGRHGRAAPPRGRASAAAPAQGAGPDRRQGVARPARADGAAGQPSRGGAAAGAHHAALPCPNPRESSSEAATAGGLRSSASPPASTTTSPPGTPTGPERGTPRVHRCRCPSVPSVPSVPRPAEAEPTSADVTPGGATWPERRRVDGRARPGSRARHAWAPPPSATRATPVARPLHRPVRRAGTAPRRP